MVMVIGRIYSMVSITEWAFGPYNDVNTEEHTTTIPYRTIPPAYHTSIPPYVHMKYGMLGSPSPR